MRAHRTDNNHAEIRDGLRELGWFVADTHDLGHGFPDLLVYRHGKVHHIEIKSPGGRLTDDERKFAAACPQPVIIAYGLQDLLDKIGP